MKHRHSCEVFGKSRLLQQDHLPYQLPCISASPFAYLTSRYQRIALKPPMLLPLIFSILPHVIISQLLLLKISLLPVSVFQRLLPSTVVLRPLQLLLLIIF